MRCRFLFLLAVLLVLSGCAQDGDTVMVIKHKTEETSAAAESTTAALTDTAPETETEAVTSAADFGSIAGDAVSDSVWQEYYASYISDGLSENAAAVAAYLAYAEQQATAEAAKDAENLVYWTDGGSVWHEDSGCSALSRAKNILSGTEDEAKAAGKDRVCQRCGGKTE